VFRTSRALHGLHRHVEADADFEQRIIATIRGETGLSAGCTGSSGPGPTRSQKRGMIMEVTIKNNEEVSKILEQWQKEINKNNIDPDKQKEHSKIIFENLGFSDIIINDNGTIDGTINNNRYEGLYLSGHKIEYETNIEKYGVPKNDVIEIKVKIEAVGSYQTL